MQAVTFFLIAKQWKWAITETEKYAEYQKLNALSLVLT